MEKTVKKYSDVLPKRLEGENVKVKDLLGKDVVIMAVQELPSQYGKEGATFYLVQAKTNDGRTIVFPAGGVLKHSVDKAVPHLPVSAKIIQKTSESGRKYITLE